MADETTETTDTTVTPTTETAPQSAAPAITMEQVQAMIAEATKQAKDSAYAQARRELQGKQPKKPDPKPQDTNETVTAPAGDDPELLEDLTDALGDFQFDKEQRREIRAAARREKPGDVDAFVARWAKLFGKTTGANATTTNTPAASTKEPAQQNKTPQPTLPSPAGTVPDREGEPAFRALSEEAAKDMWQAYVRRKGAVPGNPYDPRNRAVWRELRRRFEAEASISSIHLGARRG